MANRIQARLFGNFDLLIDGQSLHLSQPRIQSLLAFLLLHSTTAQPRQRLAYLLWGETEEQQSRTNLRNLLFQLRQLWQECDHFLRVERYEIGWQSDVVIDLDVTRFESLLAESDITSLEQARTLYGGKLLPDLFDDWIGSEQERLHTLFLSVLERLVLEYASRGDHGAAIARAEELLNHDPLREESYCQLINLYGKIGDFARLERTYRACVALLRQQLDFAPSERIEDAYRSWMQSKAPAPKREPNPAVADDSLAAEVDKLTSPLYNFPAQSSLFVPRTALVAQIASQLQEPDCRLLTLLGVGGIGKTSLAIAVANLLSSSSAFVNGIYFVDLTTVRSPVQLLSALVRSLQITLNDQGSQVSQLLHHLKSASMLLVLDNYEHLLPELALISEILAAAPAVTLLITSRSALNLRAERRFLVPGLSHPGPSESADASTAPQKYEAVELFLRVANHIQPEFVFTQQSYIEVERICRLVDGSPLALEMAAGWLRLFNCQEIRSQLESDVDLLVAQSHDIPTRQQSMRAVIESSWQLLTEPEQRILAQMSVFVGTFTPEMAMSITGARVVDLSTLIDKTFLARSGNRLHLHELLRQFASEILIRLCEEQSAQSTPAQGLLVCEVGERHAHYFLGRIAQQESALVGEKPIAVVRQLEADLGNIRSAWHWASVNGKINLLVESLLSFSRIFIELNICNEADEILATTYAAIVAFVKHNPLVRNEGNALLARLMAQRGLICFRLEDFAQARALADQVQAHAVLCDDVVSLAQAQLLLGRICNQQAQLECAGYHLQRALNYCQQIDTDHRLYALIYNELGSLHRIKSDITSALRYRKQALTHAQSVGDRVTEASIYYQIAVDYWHGSQTSKAFDTVQKAEELATELEHQNSLSHCKFLRGLIYARQQNYEAAQKELEPLLDMTKSTGLKSSTAEILQSLSSIYLHLGNSAMARESSLQALQLHRQLGNTNHEIECLLKLADIEQMAQNYTATHELLLLILQSYQQLHYDRGILYATCRLAVSYQRIGDLDQARHSLDRALALATAQNEESFLPFCYVEKANLAMISGALTAAENYVAVALSLLDKLGEENCHLDGIFLRKKAREILQQLNTTST